MTLELARRLFTVDEYHRMAELPRYAAADVPEAWIVDLEGAAVEIYREPSCEGYRVARRVERGAVVAPTAFPDVVLPVAEILG